MADPTTSAGTQPRAQAAALDLQTVTPLVTVNDLRASIRWYSDVMGFEMQEEWKSDEGEVRGVRMRAGSVDFNLSQDDFAKGRDRPKGVGFRLYCRTSQDLHVIAAGIKARGGTLDMEPTTMPWGSVFAVSDPDGYKISIGCENES